MKNLSVVFFLLICVLWQEIILAQTPGFYKDLFMDGGVSLTDRMSLPAAKELNLDMEYLATELQTLQDSILISNKYDENGVLLYPDGAPRFRVLYTNGGKATQHGNSIGEIGRNHVRNFYYNGGGFVGTCAGAFIASLHWDVSGTNSAYYHIWPGRAMPADFPNGGTNHKIISSSPILRYFDFGNDGYIENIMFAGGCYANEQINFPSGTEEILRYNMTGQSDHNKISCWAYKQNDKSGRLVVIGCHPESYVSGERLDLMKALILYAADGQGNVQLKGELQNHQVCCMNKSTTENDPLFSKIGDKQYHHFKIEIPEQARDLKVKIESTDSENLNLYLKYSQYAFENTADTMAVIPGKSKSILLPSPKPGTLFIGVECAETVITKKQYWGYAYIDNLQVLNGIEYSIVASWDSVTSIVKLNPSPKSFALFQNYPNPFNSKTTISYQLPFTAKVELCIFNILGQKVHTLVFEKQMAGKYKVEWEASGFASGIYFYGIRTDNGLIQTKKLLLQK